MTFKEQLPTEWQANWDKMGYDEASLIQKELFAPLQAGESMVGVSPTGSGKTLAYLWPLLTKIKSGEGNQLLILLPSQELAVQVANVTKEWAGLIGLKSESLIGGANVKRQVEKLKNKPEILVGTPGRIWELIKIKKVKAHLLNTLVLDEVDQLVEVSELNATNHIMKAVDKQIQLVAVSATAVDIDQKLSQLGKSDLKILDVTNEDQSAGEVTHGFFRVQPRKRVELLRKLSNVDGFKGIIFFNEVQEMGFVADKLAFNGVPNVTLASDQNKMERKMALSAFAENKVNLLLTTDLGARGLDFDALPYVIHYDVPYRLENYVHRSGRTGRMGQDGMVLSMVSDFELVELKKLVRQKDWDVTEMIAHSQKILPLVEAGHLEKETTDKPVTKKTGKPQTTDPLFKSEHIVVKKKKAKIKDKKKKSKKVKKKK
ncbi:DEAD/DEAH box helicase [Vagococcus coleopterorum]|uniref:DEAD/DEAH box helicase n=1 Tax=Vagococcus coleopterorum TaxID=2714946 RepID=A0A6G8AKZ7_9ENTE|nr:DEAD/DEAH box helicase [Vagococcus coleopterorum]QIL45676.1 DEAD/DEAH box helicase [Vagococcus coleopterorum]